MRDDGEVDTHVTACVWALFYRDLWGPVWPNLAASAIVWLPAFLWHHRRVKAHISNEIAKAVNSSDSRA
jgi:hypothetical protein